MKELKDLLKRDLRAAAYQLVESGEGIESLGIARRGAGRIDVVESGEGIERRRFRMALPTTRRRLDRGIR